jgi:hypothetical protein
MAPTYTLFKPTSTIYIGKAAWKLLGRPIAAEILEGEARAQAAAVPHVSFYSPQFDAGAYVSCITIIDIIIITNYIYI